MDNILKFPITMLRDSDEYRDWKFYSSLKDMTMEKFVIEAIKEKCDRIKEEGKK